MIKQKWGWICNVILSGVRQNSDPCQSVPGSAESFPSRREGEHEKLGTLQLSYHLRGKRAHLSTVLFQAASSDFCLCFAGSVLSQGKPRPAEQGSLHSQGRLWEIGVGIISKQHKQQTSSHWHSREKSNSLRVSEMSRWARSVARAGAWLVPAALVRQGRTLAVDFCCCSCSSRRHFWAADVTG